jgi:hypothetical protein
MYYNPTTAANSIFTASTTGTKLDSLIDFSGYDSGMNKVLITNEDASIAIRVLPGVAPTATEGFLIPAGETREFEGTSAKDWYVSSASGTPKCSVLIGKRDVF